VTPGSSNHGAPSHPFIDEEVVGMRVAVRRAHRLAGLLTIAFLAAACGGGGSEEAIPGAATMAPGTAPGADGSGEGGGESVGAIGLPLQVPELTRRRADIGAVPPPPAEAAA
jgi:hypothetical protein